MYFYYFTTIFPLKRTWPFIWKKLESSWPIDAVCQLWLKLTKLFWKRGFFKVITLLYHFPIISPLGRAWPFIWTNLQSLQQRILCAKMLLKLAQWFWRRWFLKVILFFCYLAIFSPLGRACMALHLKKNLNPLHQGILCAKFGWNRPMVLEKKIKMWKDYRRTDRQTTDDRWSEKFTWAFSSGELKSAKKRTWQQKGKKWALRRFEYALYCFRITFLCGIKNPYKSL